MDGRHRGVTGRHRFGPVGLLLGLALAAAVLPAAAGGGADPASPEGIWLTEDRDGAIEIYSCGAKLCGRLVWFETDPKPEDHRHTGSPVEHGSAGPDVAAESLCRLQLLGDLVAAGDHTWKDGWILDPETGRTYSARLTLESATTLRVRGYIGIPLLGGSQLWTRAPAGLPLCETKPGQPG